MHTRYFSFFTSCKSLSLVKVCQPASCTTTVSKNAKRTVAGAPGKSAKAQKLAANGCFPHLGWMPRAVQIAPFVERGLVRPAHSRSMVKCLEGN